MMQRPSLAVLTSLLLAGCAARPLDLPVGGSAADAGVADLGRDLSGRSDLAVASDLAFASDLGLRSDLAGGLDFATSADLASVDLACDGCGRTCASLCELGQPCQRDEDCVSNACDALSSRCVADPCDDHHRDGRESDVDCGDGVCLPCPGFWHCDEDSNCQSQLCRHSPYPVLQICGYDHCSDGRLDADETDVDCGGSQCRGCEVRLHCNITHDCSDVHDGLVCVNHLCLDPICNDGMKDGFESDVDCGVYCLLCSTGQHCNGGYDCLTGICGGVTPGVCLAPAAPTCSDHLQNGDETDIDCGGSCAPCAIGSICGGDADCQTQACDLLRGRCTNDPCKDHRRDGAESDVDCGGPSCAGCPPGGACTSDGDCGIDRCHPAANVCVPPWCLDGKLDGSESDVDCGGACLGCPIDAGCRVDQDCASLACDATTRLCVADACSDHWKEGTESAVDCGGPCGGCVIVDECQSDAECAGLICDLATHLCHVSWCPDGVQDHGESDVDCGVGTCAQCALDQKCNIDGDCLSNVCDAVSGVCTSDHCKDHRVDFDETDVDCGGLACPSCIPGKMCRYTFDCTPGHVCAASTHTCQ